MKLSKQQIRTITQGALDVIEAGDYIGFKRFTDEECAVTGNANRSYPAGVQLIFRTDGTSLRLCGRTVGKTGVRSYYTFDIFENGKPVGTITNLNDEDAIGDYASKVYPVGEFESEFTLGAGDKLLRIVMPHSVHAEISELTITDASYITPVPREKKLVAYGDSITQGYDALHPSNTYTMRLAEALGAELFSKGLGGECFSPAMAAASGGVTPDAVLAAYGTNDWKKYDRTAFTANAEGFFENLTKQYANIPIYAITPIWRKDCRKVIPSFGEFSELETVIRAVCSPYPNIHVIRGMPLVPHREECFGDLFLHPNDTGFKEYAANLLEIIKL